MRDAKNLLDQFLGQVDLSSITGQQAQPDGQGTAASSTPAQSGLNLDGLLSGRGGLATGAVAGGLVGLLLGVKSGRKLAGGALKVGGTALVGGLAYKAWKDYQDGKSAEGSAPSSPSSPAPTDAAATPPLPIEDASGTGFMPEEPSEQEALSQALIAAMIGAAKADGHVTEEERTRIGAALEKLTIEGDQRAFIQEELAKPLDVGAIASLAKSEEQRVEIYAASLIAVDPEGPAEKGYLAMLAARLQLESGLVTHLHANADKLLA